jgi:hypothetical protein
MRESGVSSRRCRFTGTSLATTGGYPYPGDRGPGDVGDDGEALHSVPDLLPRHRRTPRAASSVTTGS